MRGIHYLLLFVPISAGLQFFAPHTPPYEVAIFITACLAIVPLAGMMGEATDEISKHTGPSIGGLLNATFGNAAELIIAIFALKAGLLDVVQASITGSIVGNILLVLGLAIVTGGWNRTHQTFNRTLASSQSSMLLLATAGLFVPALFVQAQPGMQHVHGESFDPRVWRISLAVAGVLMAVYLFGLLFSLKTHRAVFATHEENEQAEWPLGRAIGVLAGATAFVAWMSELLVSSVEPMTHALHLSPLFVGVIIVPIVGNAAEHATAVTMAARNKMDIAISIAIGSGTQVALLVAPLLVFASVLFGHQLSLIFGRPELVAVAFAVMIVAFVAHDGETNWLEGIQLLAVYVVIALSFYLVLPQGGAPTPAAHR